MDFNGDMARMMSNAMGMDLENAYGKVFSAHLPPPIRNFDDLRQRMDTGPLKPVSRVPGAPISAKEFIDMATKNFGMDRSSAMAAFAHETGRDLESVIQEASSPDLKPLNGTFSPPSTRPWASPAEGVGAHSPRACTAPFGTFSPPRGTWRTSDVSSGSSEADRELLARVQNTDLSDSKREGALRELIEHGAVDELYTLVNDTDRCDSWRKQALDTLCEVSESSSAALERLYQLVNNADRCDSWRYQALRRVIESGRFDLLERLVNNTDRCDSWRAECLGALCEMASSYEVAECLLRIVNNTDRCDSWRHQALRALIDGGCRSQLREIADNTDRCSSWRREAREALGEE